MKKFVFRLETLLRHRSNLEERERGKFTRLRNERLAEIAHRDALSESQAQTRRELAAIQCSNCDPQEIQWCSRFLTYLSEEMKRSTGRLVELEKRLETQKQIMVASMRDRKIIENLKKKQAQEFLVAEQREEQKTIDEIVVMRFAAAKP
jgi:flagellar FliJ protein